MKHVNTEFKIYRKENVKINASLFDLLDGDYETKQTKALSYIFNMYPSFVKDIFKIIPNLKYENFDELIVDAELRTEKKQRSDILLRMYNKKSPVVALLFEAKNIKSKIIDIESIEEKIEIYLKDPILNEFNNKIHGIILTKNELLSEKFKCVTWNKMIDVLNSYYNKSKINRNLIKEFSNFLIKTNKTMEYFEKEVASIPAQSTIENVEKYSIYHRPTDKDAIKKSLYVTFRKEGGRMEKLYKVKRILTLPDSYINRIRKNKSNEEFEIEDLEKTDYKNIREYIKNCLTWDIKNDYNFYVLDKDNYINLKNQDGTFPRPKRNNLGYWYYSLSELLSGKEIVEVDSK